MCTAVFYNSSGAFFGRNLDLEYSGRESVVIVPEKFSLRFRNFPEPEKRFSVIGTAVAEEGFPLFYDGMNEHGLCGACLNFPGEAKYFPEKKGEKNIASYEVLPLVLRTCSNLSEAKSLLEHANILDTDFSRSFPATPLHWIFADKTGSFAAEPLENGLEITENPVGVLTNSPSFDFHIKSLENHLNLTPFEPENRFSKKLFLSPFSRGTGAFGLPGDSSSSSRFIKAAFMNLNSLSGETDGITQLFHILGSVEQIRGTVRLSGGELEKTVYTACMDIEKRIYYYRTYENSRITGIRFFGEKFPGDGIISYPMRKKQDFLFEN